MRSVIIEKPGKMTFADSPVPNLPEGFALVKVSYAAVCATDLEVIDGNIAANFPLIPGHEWSGVVVKTESEKDAHWIGKRVVGSNDVVCLTCDACRRGEWRYCKSFEEIGFKRNGAYAEYIAVPAYGLCELDDSVDMAEAALCEPLGVALGTMKKSHAKMGDTCLIIGAGSIGLCTLAVAKAMGLSKITVAATTEGRLSLAKEMGAYETVATRERDLVSAMLKIHPEGTGRRYRRDGNRGVHQPVIKDREKGRHGRFGRLWQREDNELKDRRHSHKQSAPDRRGQQLEHAQKGGLINGGRNDFLKAPDYRDHAA